MEITFLMSLVSITYEEFLQLNNKKRNKSINNNLAILICISEKRIYKWPIKQMKTLLVNWEIKTPFYNL